MKGFFVGLSKLILGIAIALILLSMAGVATARYFMGRLSVLPPKPFYSEEMPAEEMAPEIASETAPETASELAPAAPPEEAAPPEPALEPGAYEAVVVQPIGLVMREGPGVEYAQVGGVDVNETVTVLEEPADQSWMKVRVVSNGQEGWVRSGNTRRVD
jgi:uncharacterized protein YgiM (DUF1202 family)